MMNDEEYITCPYNSSHRIPRSRFQRHLVKCQKTNPPMSICPFNATHRVPEELLKEHCLNCPNRRPDEMEEEYQKPKSCIGAITAPKPILQKEYLPETDPDNDYWDD